MTHPQNTEAGLLTKSYIELAKEETLWQTNLSEALNLIAQRSQAAIKASRCSIWLFNNNKKELRCQVMRDDTGYVHTHDKAIRSSDYPVYINALESDQTISASMALNDPRTQCFADNYLIPNNIHALLDATLRQEGAACGVICFEQTNTPRTWSHQEISFAASVADLLSQLLMFYSLRNSELRYRTVFDSTGDALIILRSGKVSDCNAAALKLFRCNRQQFIGQPTHKLWAFTSRKTHHTYERFEWLQTRWDNTQFYADVTLTHTKLEQQEHLIASVRDISDKKQASDQLTSLNSLHQAIFNGTNYCIIATDLNGIIHTFNRAAEEHLSYKAEEVIGLHTPLIFHSNKELNWRAEALTRELGYELQPNFEALVAKARLGQVEEYEWQYQRKDETQLPISLAVAPLRDQQEVICGFLFMAADITERKRASEQLIDSKREMERRANHDSLTGLPNRARLHDVAAIAIHNASKNNNKAALMLLDLNRFKDINDTLGHAIGDQILKEIAKRLQAMLIRHGAYLYRLGGDEFAVLIAKISEGDETLSLASFIDASLRIPIEADGITLEIDGSIGIALYPDHGQSSHALLRCADVAMYTAKTNAQPLAFYDAAQDAHSPRRLMLMAELGNAIRQNELILHYQPKVDLKTGECIGCEALIRWQHPKLGQVPPFEFIPMAEMSDIIKPLSEWVLVHALEQTKAWHQKGIPMKVSINLSARNLIDYDFPILVERHLKEKDFPAESLEIEITESALISDPERSLHIINRMHDLGVRFAIDDFGTGYSSMSYLKRLPLSTLKIDRTFVHDMLNDTQDAAIIRSTISLAHSFDLTVVAEGVEDAATMIKLAELDCEMAQGYHIAKPLPPAQFEAWFLKHQQKTLNTQ
ncbi:GGDEF and EAL domain-containing protein [Marinagarivorans algicola]|uniref:bifunctional diguanylate cyclase/phosphodiesterase n=1 Tax=Marinagarivorans algicola TaxID=1513270 RepID=UPI0006B46BA6|nr:GGDEF and EAL domain-containing protein [Marinagarivorans algicola]